MACLAWRRGAQSARMMGVVMAGRAGNALCDKAFVDMASPTLLLCMLTQKREAGQRVIKTDPHCPTVGTVAALTVAAQLPGMGIIFGMTGAALG